MCLPRAPALRQVLEAVLARGALESPSIIVLAFHSSLSFVEGSSDGLASCVRALLDGCVSLAPFMLSSVTSARAHSSGWLFLLLWPDGGFLSVTVAPFLKETIEVPMWVESFSSLSGSSTVDCFPVFPRAFSPGVVMAPSPGFRLRRSGRLGFWLRGACFSQSFHSVCSLCHILAFCAMRVGILPCSLTRCATSWLGP